jgi:hypothetical protein
MYSRLAMKAWIAAVVGAIAAPAQAAGSDVVHYPKGEAYQRARIEQHYGTGIPAPRLRSFANAPWTNLLRPNDLQGEFHRE